MELTFARAGYVHESRGISKASALAVRNIGRLRERFLVSPIGWVSLISIIEGGFSELTRLIFGITNMWATRGFQVPVPHEIATVFGVSDFLQALIPALGVLDGGLTVLVASLVLRYGISRLVETKKPVVAGITALRLGRVKTLARKMAGISSMRVWGQNLTARGIAPFQNGRAYIAVRRSATRKNSVWAHELGHVIAYHVTGGSADALAGYKNDPGASDMYTVYRRLYPKTSPHDPWQEAFAEFCEQYIRHPLITKMKYPRGCALMRRIVNNSPAGQFIQFA